MGLQVAVGAGDVSHFDGEKDVAIVVGPARTAFDGLVMGDAARLHGRSCAGVGGRGRPPHIDRVDLDVFVFFLALVDGIADVGELGAVGRSNHAIHAQGRGGYGASAGRDVGIFLGLAFFVFDLGRSILAASKSGSDVEREDRVTALAGTVLHDIFPFTLVLIFLLFRPRLAGGEVDGLRIGRPGEGVDVFFSL